MDTEVSGIVLFLLIIEFDDRVKHTASDVRPMESLLVPVRTSVDLRRCNE